MRLHIIPKDRDRTIYSKALDDIFNYVVFDYSLSYILTCITKKKEEDTSSKLEACIEALQGKAYAVTATVPIELKNAILDISYVAKKEMIISSTKVDAVFLLEKPVKKVNRDGFLYYVLTDNAINNANMIYILQTIAPKVKSIQHKHMQAKETHIGLYGKSFEVTDDQSRYLDIGNISVKEPGIAHMICNPLDISARNFILKQGLDEKTVTAHLKWPESIDKLFN